MKASMPASGSWGRSMAAMSSRSRHLEAGRRTLHPVQQAMVDFHGSQCGFCTPGFVMSLYALWMREPAPSDAAIEKALQGEICAACTGYEPIVKAARAFGDYGEVANDPRASERAEMAGRLAALRDGLRVEIGQGKDRLVVPGSLDDLAEFSRSRAAGDDRFAGSTDVGALASPQAHARHSRRWSSSAGCRPNCVRSSKTRPRSRSAPMVSYTDAYRSLGARIPAWRDLLDRIGGDQVRNMGHHRRQHRQRFTHRRLPRRRWIALGATLTLRKGSETRILPLKDFFIGLRQAGPAARRIRPVGYRPLAESGARSTASTR